MVTGDAVVLDVQIAQLPVRAVGALIDIVIMVLLNIIATVLWALTLRQFDPAIAQAIVVIFTVLVSSATRWCSRQPPAAVHRASSRWAAGGVRGRRPGAVPSGPVPRAGRPGRDLDALRRAGGDRQHGVG